MLEEVVLYIIASHDFSADGTGVLNGQFILSKKVSEVGNEAAR